MPQRYVKVLAAASQQQTTQLMSKQPSASNISKSPGQNAASSSHPFRGRGHNSLSVHIPTPCHENWDAMTPAQQGRFCQSCAKTVVDFSLMTDSEVLNYFGKATGNTCGRFANDQLQRPLQPVKQDKRKGWWIAAMMPLLMMFERAGAQKKNSKPKEDTIIVTSPIMLGMVMPAPVPANDTIKGKVVDTLGNPIPFASISINGKYKGIDADSSGEFSIPIATKNYSTQLEASAIGYSTGKIDIDGEMDKYVIVLKSLENKLAPFTILDDSKRITKGGAWAVCTIRVTAKDTILKILNPAFKIYPNPAPRGSSVNIDVKEEGNYSIQLFDNSGKLVQVNTFNALKGLTQTTINIPQTVAAGMYYIRLINEQNKKQYTDKIVVM